MPVATTVVAQDDSQDLYGRHIRHISLQQANVFPDEEESTFESMVNSLHMVTREGVIRGRLLFEEGDVLDEELLHQSKRRLRSLDNFSHVAMRLEAVGIDSVDVTVETIDQWSTLPNVVIDGGGGLRQLGVQLVETNFLGRGKGLYLEALNESDVGTTWTAGYDDPQLLGSRWTADLVGATGPLTDGIGGSLRRPFYSVDTKWSYGTDASVVNDIKRVFFEGEEFSRYELDSQFASAFVARAYGERLRKIRLRLSYRYELRDFHEIEDQTILPISDDETIHAMTFRASRENKSYVETTGLNQFITVEDIALGRVSWASVGRAGFPVPVGVQRWEFGVGHREAHRFGEDHFWFSAARLTTLTEKDTVFSLGSQFYRNKRRHTFAVNLRLKWGYELEEGRQFTLGADSGLRGYPARQFSGDKLFVLNVEERLMPGWELFTIQLGAVAFVDAGNVWKPSQDFGSSALNYSAGVGLRLGFSKLAGATVARFDAGWPLDWSGGPEFTLGVDQHF